MVRLLIILHGYDREKANFTDIKSETVWMQEVQWSKELVITLDSSKISEDFFKKIKKDFAGEGGKTIIVHQVVVLPS